MNSFAAYHLVSLGCFVYDYAFSVMLFTCIENRIMTTLVCVDQTASSCFICTLLFQLCICCDCTALVGLHTVTPPDNIFQCNRDVTRTWKTLSVIRHLIVV